MRLICYVVPRKNVPLLIAIIKRIDSRGQSVLQIARHGVEINLTVVKPQMGFGSGVLRQTTTIFVLYQSSGSSIWRRYLIRMGAGSGQKLEVAREAQSSAHMLREGN
jgi:hypothetical protein